MTNTQARILELERRITAEQGYAFQDETQIKGLLQRLNALGSKARGSGMCSMTVTGSVTLVAFGNSVGVPGASVDIQIQLTGFTLASGTTDTMGNYSITFTYTPGMNLMVNAAGPSPYAGRFAYYSTQDNVFVSACGLVSMHTSVVLEPASGFYAFRNTAVSFAPLWCPSPSTLYAVETLLGTATLAPSWTGTWVFNYPATGSCSALASYPVGLSLPNTSINTAAITRNEVGGTQCPLAGSGNIVSESLTLVSAACGPTVIDYTLVDAVLFGTSTPQTITIHE